MTDRQLPRRRRPVSPEGMTRLENWASRKPCIALMGEFSAGKTTLTNLLVGEDVLPTRVTATQLPPVWMSYGEPEAWYVDTEGHRHDLDFDGLHQVPVEGVRYIRLFCKGRILETIDLIDTPGISDPNIPKTVWEMAVGYVNAVLWCTHSTQAWRESERSAWESLPERLRENSVLLATRADKLLPAERERVARRLRREAGDMFRSIIMFSAMDAIRAASDDETGELWTESGGEALLSALQEIAHDIIEARKGLLSRYAVIDGTKAARPSRPAPSRPTPSGPSRTVRPVRLERDDSARRPRLSRDDAESMRSKVIDGEAAEAPAETSEVLHLSFAQRVGHAARDEGPDVKGAEDISALAETDASAESDPVLAAMTDDADDLRDAEAAELAEDLSLPDLAQDDPAEDETAGDEMAGEDTDLSDEGEAEDMAEAVPMSATRIWRDVLAAEPEARSIKDVLALVEKFLIEVDRAEGIEPDLDRSSDAGLRRHG